METPGNKEILIMKLKKYIKKTMERFEDSEYNPYYEETAPYMDPNELLYFIERVKDLISLYETITT
jgi:hypothetical protein